MPTNSRKRTQKTAIDLSVILPAYNEEATIQPLIKSILEVLGKSKLSYELLIIDDGSGDRTALKTTSVEKTSRGKVRLIRHPYNKGNGASIKTGIRAARGRCIACMDADGQHDPEDLLTLYKYSGEYQLVVGARTQEYRGHRVRNLGNLFFNALARSLTSFPIEDLTSGFRLFSADVIKHYVELLPARFSYPTTSTLVFLKAGYNIKYVPIKMLPRQKGVSKISVFRDGWRFLVIILKIIVLFEPLQIFLPVASLFFIFALGTTAYSIATLHRLYIPNSGTLFFSIAVLVFLLGLIAEQVTNLQLVASKHDD